MSENKRTPEEIEAEDFRRLAKEKEQRLDSLITRRELVDMLRDYDAWGKHDDVSLSKWLANELEG